MWHLISDGFGGWLIIEDDPTGDAIAGGMINGVLFLIGLLFAWLAWALGDALMLPVACLDLLLIILLIARTFGANINEDKVLWLLVAMCPVLMYAWGCLCFGMIRVFDSNDAGYLAFIAYIIAGFAMLALVGGFALENDMPVLALVFAACQFFVWWAAIGARSYGDEGVSELLLIVFRVLGIVSAIAILPIMFVMATGLVRRDNTTASEADRKETMLGAAALVFGFVPMLVCGSLWYSMGGIVPAILMVVLMAAVAAIIVFMGKDVTVRLIGLVVGYLVALFCFLVVNADLSVAIPLEAGNAVLDALRGSGLMRSMSDAFVGLGWSMYYIFDAVINWVLSVVFGIFNAEAPYIELNGLAVGILGFAPLICSISLGIWAAGLMRDRSA